MTNQEQSEKIVYGSLITSTKCYNCIHFPLCFAQKGGANLELASENDCCYYQSKLPKDSVVLTREEYDKLKHFEHRVRSGVCMTQKEWFDFCNEDSNRRTCLRIEEREQERKETATEILQYIGNLYDDCDQRFRLKDYQWHKNLCKKYGVEIK